MPNEFDKLMSPSKHRERMAVRARETFEDGKVQFLLRGLHLSRPQLIRDMRRLCDDRNQSDALTFEVFNELYPTFPVRFVANNLAGITLHTDRRSMLPALFRRFGDAPFVRAYEEIYEQLEPKADGKIIAMVFPRKGLRNGLVIYTADDPSVIALTAKETCITYVSGKRNAQHWIVVRSYQKVVEALHNHGRGWRPPQ